MSGCFHFCTIRTMDFFKTYLIHDERFSLCSPSALNLNRAETLHVFHAVTEDRIGRFASPTVTVIIINIRYALRSSWSAAAAPEERRSRARRRRRRRRRLEKSEGKVPPVRPSVRPTV